MPQCQPHRRRRRRRVCSGWRRSPLGLPQQVPPSWTVSAGRTLWLGAPMVAFLLPTARRDRFPVAGPLRQASRRRVGTRRIRSRSTMRSCCGSPSLSWVSMERYYWRYRTAIGTEVGGGTRPPDAGLHDDQHRESASENSTQSRDRHPHTASRCADRRSGRACTEGGIYDRRMWRGHRPVSDCSASTRRARDDPLVGPAALAGAWLVVRFSRKHVHA